MAAKDVKPDSSQNPAEINPCFVPESNQNPAEFIPCFVPEGSQNPAELDPCVIPEGSQNPAEINPCFVPESNQNPAEYIPCFVPESKQNPAEYVPCFVPEGSQNPAEFVPCFKPTGGGSSFLPAVQKVVLWLLGILGLLGVLGLFAPTSALQDLGKALIGSDDWEKQGCVSKIGNSLTTVAPLEYDLVGVVEVGMTFVHETADMTSADPLKVALDGLSPDFLDDAFFSLFKALNAARIGIGLEGFLPPDPCSPPQPPPADTPTEAPGDNSPALNTCGDGVVGEGEQCDGKDLTQCYLGQVCSKCQCVPGSSGPTDAPTQSTVCTEHCEGSTFITADCVEHLFNPICTGGTSGGGCPCVCDPATGRCVDCNRNRCGP